jgi:hypothetical protein
VETPETAKGTPKVLSHGQEEAAEVVEGRGLAKGNLEGCDRDRTLRRGALQQALDRARQAARRARLRLTALWHHVYDIDRLREAYYSVNRQAAPGVEGQTWTAYGADLETNRTGLADRLKRGAYHAPPVERVYIPKAEGRDRPIGKPTLEDKLVQRATAEVLNAVFEAEFLGLSYGSRPGRGPHDALDAVTVGIEKRNINGVLDADIRGFFDTASPRLAGGIRRASDRGAARRASHPQVAERRRAGGWAMARPRGRDTPRGKCEPGAFEHLPPLRL